MMPRLLVPSIVIVLATGIACRPAASQNAVQEARLPSSFGSVSNVIELGNGWVAFTDTRKKLFLRADLRSGQVDTLGSRADSLAADSPAGQYKFPGWVAHLAGDTIALVDFSVLRTTLWNDAGRPVGILPLKPVAGGTPVLVYDTVGRGYKIDYQAILGGGEPGRSLRPDSIPLLRLTVKTGVVDTVALLAAPEYGDAVIGEQVQQVAKVFAPNDFFGVLPDGALWVARARQNRVDWRSPAGAWTLGRQRPYSRIPVTQADKDRVLTQVREQGKQFGMPQDLSITYPFAETKPPFDFALGSPKGEVWLQRPRRQEGDGLIYDVVDRRGIWRREVAFPTDASLAGFGRNGAIYASVKNVDGSRTVARFRVK
jgi:hypothetical protein